MESVRPHIGEHTHCTHTYRRARPLRPRIQESTPTTPHVTTLLCPLLPTSTTQRPRPSVHPALEVASVLRELPRLCPTHTILLSCAHCPSLVRMDALLALGDMMEQKVGGYMQHSIYF